MNRLISTLTLSALGLTGAAAVTVNATSYAAPLQRDPSTDIQRSGAVDHQTAVFAGGCFWGVEGVFEHVKGVSKVVSGYAGGQGNTANYGQVSSGRTGHAEAVRITYDPARISYGQLLQVFFSVAHNPTELNRQGPDTGTQYRSAIFYANADQKRVADAYIAQLKAARVFTQPIVTQLTSLKVFYDAEAYHQDYLAAHPNQPYIVMHDQPKIDHLKRQFPALYVSK